MIGIVSTEPGFVAGGYTPNGIPIALKGRVPLKILTKEQAVLINQQMGREVIKPEDLVIQSGDPLTSSPIAGVGMKATRPGMIIGRALTSYNPNLHTVMTFIQPEQYFGEGAQPFVQLVQRMTNWQERFEKTTPLAQILAQDPVIQASNSTFLSATDSALAFGESTVAGQVLGEQISSSPAVAVIEPENTSSGSSSTVLYVPPAGGGLLSASEIRKKVSELNLTEEDVVIPVTAGLVERYLQVDGDAFVAGRLGVSQTVHVGEGIVITGEGIESSAKNVSGEVKVLSGGRGKLSILGDRLVINADGKVSVNGDVSMNGQLEAHHLSSQEMKTGTLSAAVASISGQIFTQDVQVSTAVTLSAKNTGKVVLAATKDTVEVVFETPFSSKPYLQIAGEGIQTSRFKISSVSATGFTIKVDQPLEKDQVIRWLAVEGAREK
jgi:hypothetical protein